MLLLLRLPLQVFLLPLLFPLSLLLLILLAFTTATAIDCFINAGHCYYSATATATATTDSNATSCANPIPDPFTRTPEYANC